MYMHKEAITLFLERGLIKIQLMLHPFNMHNLFYFIMCSNTELTIYKDKMYLLGIYCSSSFEMY